MSACAGGYMGHQFDRDTHRCKRCQRYQPGFAPKKEYSKTRAECQVCERQQACDKDGSLGHHGYQRPGFGFIVGDCFGQNHQPFPATSALELWAAQLDRIEANLQAELTLLQADKIDSFSFTYAPDAWRKREKTTVTVKRGDKDRYLQQAYLSIPAFETLRNRAIASTRQQLERIPAERARVLERIAKAHRLQGEAK